MSRAGCALDKGVDKLRNRHGELWRIEDNDLPRVSLTVILVTVTTKILVYPSKAQCYQEPHDYSNNNQFLEQNKNQNPHPHRPNSRILIVSPTGHVLQAEATYFPPKNIPAQAMRGAGLPTQQHRSYACK